MDTLNAETVLSDFRVRKFLRELCLESCGVDIALGIPVGKVFSEYEQGKHKLPIDLLNFMIYDNPKSFRELLKEVNEEDRRNS